MLLNVEPPRLRSVNSSYHPFGTRFAGRRISVLRSMNTHRVGAVSASSTSSLRPISVKGVYHLGGKIKRPAAGGKCQSVNGLNAKALITP